MGKKKGDTVVKIDSELLEDVQDFINRDENKFKYVNRKQFVDIAVMQYLKKEKRRMNDKS